MDISDASAASRTIELGGETYTLSPLTVSDYGVLEKWIRGRVISLARDNLDGFDLADRKILLSEAFQSALALHMGDLQSQAMLASIDGQALTFSLSVRRHHPDITHAKACEVISNEMVAQKAVKAIEEINNVPQELIPPAKATESDQGKDLSRKIGQPSTGN